MKKVNTTIQTKHFVKCPHCEESTSRIDHLFSDDNKAKSWGPWYCDECGRAYFGGESDEGRQRYFYEEHTCPTNYLGVEMVVDLNDGDTDPHGVFNFVGAIPYVDPENVDDILSLLPGGENF